MTPALQTTGNRRPEACGARLVRALGLKAAGGGDLA